MRWELRVVKGGVDVCLHVEGLRNGIGFVFGDT
jgi:hypothetical protein